MPVQFHDELIFTFELILVVQTKTETLAAFLCLLWKKNKDSSSSEVIWAFDILLTE